MEFDFDTPIDRSGTASLKWHRYEGRDIIPMWVADMDFRSPPAVIEALHARVDHGVFGYTLPPRELTDTLISRLARLYDWQIEADWLVWLPGLVTGLNVCCRAIGGPGDEVISFTPIYPPFLSAPGNLARRLVKVPLTESEAGWHFDLELFKRRAKHGSLLLLCHPHNPVGRAWQREELAKLAEICRARDMVVCSDEIHCDLILDRHRKHIPFACLDDDTAQRTITLMAPSKTYNIPGLGCSFAIIPSASLRRAFRFAMTDLVPFINTLGYTAALAAYKDGDKWLAALLDYLRGNRALIEERVAGWPRVSMPHIQATYLAWLDMRALKIENPATFFAEAGVGMSDGAEFASPGFMRLNFGCPRATLHTALDRMEKAISRI